MKNSYRIAYNLWLGLLMGLITGLFGRLINIVIYHMFSQADPFVNVKVMLILPIVGGLLLGLYKKYSHIDNPSGFDVSAVRNELYCIQSYLMRPKYLLANIVALFVSLISGWSVGKQGPVVYVGAAIGSFFAYIKKRDASEIKILITSGVSGILAAIFGTPLFAIAFVIEVILNDRDIEAWTAIVMASIVSMLVGQRGGAEITSNYIFKYIYAVKNLDIAINFEIFSFILMGMVTGFAAIIYTQSVIGMKKIFIDRNRPVVIAVFAGIIISGVGYFYPEIFDVYIQIIPRIILDDMGLYFLAGLLIAKYIVTSISLSAGGVGGVFMTGIYMGACIGKILGIIIISLGMGNMSSDVYAVIGMVAFFAGFANAPFSATLLALEITSTPAFIIPVLFVSVISAVVFKSFSKQSLYGNYNSSSTSL